MSVDASEPSHPAQPSPAPRDVRQPVLLIDTDACALEYMERALSQSGLLVLSTETLNGPDGALSMLSARDDIHVIVLDPAALGAGPDHHVAELQKRLARPDIELIIVTDSRTVSDLEQPWAREAADLLPKPLLRQTLIRAVQEAHRRHASLRDRRAPLRILSREDGVGSALPLRRPQPVREHPVELRILDALAEIDDLRTRQLDGIVEGDAAWSMLAELLRARLTRRRISVTSLCLASKSPVTTALRRIERLLEAGLVTYSLDPKDRWRKYIELTEEGALRLHGVVGHLSRWLDTEQRNGTTGL